MLYELQRRLEVVEEAVDIGEEDGDVATGREQLGDFYGRDGIGGVWLARGRGALGVMTTVRTTDLYESQSPMRSLS